MIFNTFRSERILETACQALLLGAVLTSLSCSPASETGSGDDSSVADLVLRGGKVATVDQQNSIHQAVAVRGHEIVAVGNNEEIDAWIGSDTRVVELDGRLLAPGFIEGHGHFMSLGGALMVLDLTTATRWQDIVDQVAAAAAEAPPGAWIRGRGWHQEKWSQVPPDAVEGNPVHAALSSVSPDNPSAPRACFWARRLRQSEGDAIGRARSQQ